MNKKGFTLVELLAVVVIMGILALIAVPAFTRILERGKTQQYITDAKEMISKAKYQFKMDEIELYSTSSINFSNCTEALDYQVGNCVSYKLVNLGIKEKKDPYDENYVVDNIVDETGVILDESSKVYVINLNGEYKYYIELKTASHKLEYNSNTIISEQSLVDAYIKVRNQ